MKGNSAALALQEKQAGYAWFCTDDGSFHIDYLDSDGTLKRKQINDALFTRLAALQKIVNNLLLFNSLDAGSISSMYRRLDAGSIAQTQYLQIYALDAGKITAKEAMN